MHAGHLQVVSELCLARSDPNGDSEPTPLDLAVKLRRLPIFCALLLAGATKGSLDLRPMQLMLAAFEGQEEQVEQLCEP